MVAALVAQAGRLLVEALGVGPPAGFREVATHCSSLLLDRRHGRAACGNRAFGGGGRQPARGRGGPSPGLRSRLGAPASREPHPAPVDSSDAGRRSIGATERGRPRRTSSRGRPRVGSARTRAQLGTQRRGRMAALERERRNDEEPADHDHHMQRPEADRDQESAPEHTECGKRGKPLPIARGLSRHPWEG